MGDKRKGSRFRFTKVATSAFCQESSIFSVKNEEILTNPKQPVGKIVLIEAAVIRVSEVPDCSIPHFILPDGWPRLGKMPD